MVIYIVLLWVVGICFSLPKTLSIHEYIDNNTKIVSCYSEFDDNYEKIYTIMKWIIPFVLPYILIIVFSIRLLIFIKKWSMKNKNLVSIKKKLKIQIQKKEMITKHFKKRKKALTQVTI